MRAAISWRLHLHGYVKPREVRPQPLNCKQNNKIPLIALREAHPTCAKPRQIVQALAPTLLRLLDRSRSVSRTGGESPPCAPRPYRELPAQNRVPRCSGPWAMAQNRVQKLMGGALLSSQSCSRTLAHQYISLIRSLRPRRARFSLYGGTTRVDVQGAAGRFFAIAPPVMWVINAPVAVVGAAGVCTSPLNFSHRAKRPRKAFPLRPFQPYPSSAVNLARLNVHSAGCAGAI